MNKRMSRKQKLIDLCFKNEKIINTNRVLPKHSGLFTELNKVVQVYVHNLSQWFRFMYRIQTSSKGECTE